MICERQVSWRQHLGKWRRPHKITIYNFYNLPRFSQKKMRWLTNIKFKSGAATLSVPPTTR